jgi:hypothetical protein
MTTNNNINAPLPLSPAQGGTGVSNSAGSLTFGGNVTFTGSNSFNLTLTGNTSLTAPTSGTLVSTSGVTDGSSARTFVLTDANNVVMCTGSAFTATIPPNSSVAYPLGTVLSVYSGAISSAVATIAAGAGVTLINATNPNIGPSGFIQFKQVGTDKWLMTKCYEEYSLSTNWTGIWASNQPGNSIVVRNMRSVIITIPLVTFSANASGNVSNVTMLPTRFIPADNFELTGVVVEDNGAYSTGNGTVNTSGMINISKAGYGAFSGLNVGGVSGFLRQNIAYTLT